MCYECGDSRHKKLRIRDVATPEEAYELALLEKAWREKKMSPFKLATGLDRLYKTIHNRVVAETARSHA
jgi:hypothetical protein